MEHVSTWQDGAGFPADGGYGLAVACVVVIALSVSYVVLRGLGRRHHSLLRRALQSDLDDLRRKIAESPRTPVLQPSKAPIRLIYTDLVGGGGEDWFARYCELHSWMLCNRITVHNAFVRQRAAERERDLQKSRADHLESIVDGQAGEIRQLKAQLESLRGRKRTWGIFPRIHKKH